jgi:hypothetical protein
MKDKTNTTQSGQDMLSNIAQFLPSILQTINAGAPDAAKAQLASDQAYNPGYMQLTNDLYKQYGPQLAATGNQINQQNAIAGAQTDNLLANGVGRDNVTAAMGLDKLVDPEFYANRALVGQKQQDLLNAVDPTRLTNGELENASRGLGRTGQTFLPGGISAAASAGTFGSALAGKQDRFSQYLTQASNGLNQLRSGMNGFAIATQKPQQANQGQNLFGLTQGTGNQAYNVAGNYMGGVQGNQQKQYMSALDRDSKAFQLGSSAIGSIAGGVMGGI